LEEGNVGTISFKNNGFANIIGKGTLNLGGKGATMKDVLLIENTNHCFLSISQMCDQAHKLLFDTKKCEIRKERSRNPVETSTRSPNDIYKLDEIKMKGCFLAKKHESLLWRKRMGCIKFDNLVGINKNEDLR